MAGFDRARDVSCGGAEMRGCVDACEGKKYSLDGRVRPTCGVHTAYTHMQCGTASRPLSVVGHASLSACSHSSRHSGTRRVVASTILCGVV